jgi:hypothetical protein
MGCARALPSQESPAANKIKEAFFSERGLAGNVHRLPFDKLFALDSVKKVCLRAAPQRTHSGRVCTSKPVRRGAPQAPTLRAMWPAGMRHRPQITRTADGYQPHLVSPERGLQLMASKALDQVEAPVQECVSQVYTMLIAAARDAAAVAGEHTEAAMNGKVPLNVPEFRTFIMPAVVRALDEWRTEAERSECRLCWRGAVWLVARQRRRRRRRRQQQQQRMRAFAGMCVCLSAVSVTHRRCRPCAPVLPPPPPRTRHTRDRARSGADAGGHGALLHHSGLLPLHHGPPL